MDGIPGARRAAGLAAMAALAVCAPSGAAAQSLDEIVAKNLAARGGIERLRNLQTVQTAGTLATPRGDLPVTTWAKRPYKFRRDQKLPDLATSMAFDGSTIWILDPSSGSTRPRAITGPDAEAAREEGTFDPLLLDYKERGHQVALVGNETIDGVPVHHLRVVRKGGQVEHLYLSAETGLEMRIVQTLSRGGFKTEVRTDLSDYREVDGLMFAFRIRQSSSTQGEHVFTLTNVVCNMPIDDDVFRLAK